MLYPELEEKLRSARHAFETATSENIIELGKEYVALLGEYHGKLLEHPGAPGRGLQPAPSSSYEIVHNIQETVRNLLTQTEQERSRVEAILNPFTEMTIAEAKETLNNQKYKGHDSWKFGEGGITDGIGNTLSLQEAVEVASLLRREEYIAQKKRPSE